MTRKGRGCPTPPFSVETNSGETPGHQRRREPQIAQILSRFGAGYRRQDCQGAAEPPRRTERAGAKRQTFHGHRERSVQARRAKPSTATERPCGATGETVVQSGVSRAPASPESPASPERAVPGRGRVSAPLPKAWRAKPAMPLQALRAGRAPCAHARPAPASCFVSFVIPKTHWQSACASTPPVSVTLCILCATLCSSEICGSLSW